MSTGEEIAQRTVETAGPAKVRVRLRGRGPRPTAKRSRLPSQQRREQLMRAALSVFAMHGFGEGRHARIAREAGVAPATVFGYFPTRELLFDAVLEEVSRFLTTLADGVHAQPKPAQEVLRDHVLALIRAADTHSDYVRVWLAWSTAIRYRIWTRYLDFEEDLVTVVRRTVERGQRERNVSRDVDPDDDARMVVSAAAMLARMRCAGLPPERVEQLMREMLGSVLHHDR